MSALHYADELRPPPPSVIEDEYLRERLAAATEVLFVQELQKRLRELQTTPAPPRRRDAYHLYLDGYFEFVEDPSAIKSLTPTPPSTKPTTPETVKSSNYSHNKRAGSYSKKEVRRLKNTHYKLSGRLRRSQRVKMKATHPMLRRSTASSTKRFYQLDESGQKMIRIPRPRNMSSRKSAWLACESTRASVG